MGLPKSLGYGILAELGISYTYDPLNRLTAAADHSTGEAYAYQYDSVGNREVVTDAIGVHTYAYDAANRLTGIQLPDSSIQGYTWGNRGNLLADGTFTYTYSAAGRMVRAESITTTLVYTYNADGLRVAQSQSVASVQSVDTFTWDWAMGVPELLSDGESLYLIGYDTLGWQRGADWTFVLPDALGSVRQETDATGAVTAMREWSPYGEEVGGAQTGLGYTGEWWDDAVGLQYLRARWYDGTTGRFTQRDPVATSTFYRYASNNPINRVDPSGYIDWQACAIQGDYGMCTIQSGDTYYKIARELIAAGVPANLGQIVADLTALNSQQYPNPNSIPIAGALTVRAVWIQAILQPAEFLPPSPYLPPPIVKTHSDPLVEILYEWGGVNDLEAMARTSEVLAGYYPNWPEFLDEMSETFLGVRVHGPGTLVVAAAATARSGCIGLGREERDCPANRGKPQFSDTGFHPDFRDRHNQPYHVWGYIAETALPEVPQHNTLMLARTGNLFHECGQSFLAMLGFGDGWGTSWQDFVLSYAGMEIGVAITTGEIAHPVDLAARLRSRLGPEGPGSFGMLEYWESFGRLAGSP